MRAAANSTQRRSHEAARAGRPTTPAAERRTRTTNASPAAPSPFLSAAAQGDAVRERSAAGARSPRLLASGTMATAPARPFWEASGDLDALVDLVLAEDGDGGACETGACGWGPTCGSADECCADPLACAASGTLAFGPPARALLLSSSPRWPVNGNADGALALA